MAARRINSRQKGARGEREAAQYIRNYWGVHASRGLQYQGSPDSPDVKQTMEDVNVEVKRTERFNPYQALDQACADAEIGLVLHRRSGRQWIMVLHARDFPKLVASYCRAVGAEPADFDGELF